MSQSKDRIYKRKMACFDCRKTFRQTSENVGKCPECGGELRSIGLDFKSPRRANRKQWKKAQALYESGIRFSSFGLYVGYLPKQWREVRAFLEERRKHK
jgi:hypothetical protein